MHNLWTMHGAGHSYPGGDLAGSCTDPVGPGITRATFTVILALPMP